MQVNLFSWNIIALFPGYENNTDNINIIIGIVSGVSAGILLCVIVGIIFYCHLKRTRYFVIMYNWIFCETLTCKRHQWCCLNYYFYFFWNRKKINLHQKHYKAENMQAGTHTTVSFNVLYLELAFNLLVQFSYIKLMIIQ